MNEKKNIETIKFNISSSETIKDSFSNSNSRLVNFNNNKVTLKVLDSSGNIIEEHEQRNLVVYRGRSYVAQRIANMVLDSTTFGDNTSSPTSYYNNSYITFFALGDGSGGINPVPVKSYEYKLYNHLPIKEDGTQLNSNKHLRYKFSNTSETRDYVFTGPPVLRPDPDLWTATYQGPDYEHLENVLSNEGVKIDSYLRIVYNIPITLDEYNFNPANPSAGYNLISEAGLFVAPSHVLSDFRSGGAYHEKNAIKLFAKVNFSYVMKDDSRQFIFTWEIAL